MQSNGQAQGVAALPNGNVAVAGYQGTSAVVAEWGPTGTPDSSFGNESQNGTAGSRWAAVSCGGTRSFTSRSATS